MLSKTAVRNESQQHVSGPEPVTTDQPDGGLGGVATRCIAKLLLYHTRQKAWVARWRGSMPILKPSVVAVVAAISLGTSASAEEPEIDAAAADNTAGTMLAANGPQGPDLDSVFKEEVWKRPSVTSEGETYFVIDGDILVTIDEGVALLKQRNQALAKLEERIKETGDEAMPELAVMMNNDEKSIWPETVQRLTFQIEETGFSEDELATLKVALQTASDDWNTACPDCRVEFAMFSAAATETPLFRVRKTLSTAYFAAAFFPHYAAKRHVLQVTPSFFTQRTFNHAGIMRHEFGHILGYRHEHIRHPSLQDCKYEDEKWIGLTAIDPRSVMHYLCEGKGDPELKLTSLDIQGHRFLYEASTQNASE